MTQELQQKMQKLALKEAKEMYASSALQNDFICAFMAGAAAMYAELAPLVEWIDVNERLPEKEGLYIVKWRNIIGELVTSLSYLVNDKFVLNAEIWRKIEL